MIKVNILKLLSLLIIAFALKTSFSIGATKNRINESCRALAIHGQAKENSVIYLCEEEDYRYNLILKKNIDEENILDSIHIPFSHSLKLEQLADNYTYIFYIDISEPDIKNSYYYIIFNTNTESVLLSGKSDSLVMVKDLDQDGLKEIITWKNMTRANSLEILMEPNYYPIVFKLDNDLKLELSDATNYSHFYREYINRSKVNLALVKSKLNSKSTGLNKKMLQNELNFLIALTN